MKLQKTIFPILILISVFLASCSSDDKDDAQVTVTVVSDKGERVPNEIVQMFDEKTYAEFEKDNTTLPNAVLKTNSNGVVTFTFPYEEWFAAKKDRLFSFVVQYGSGTSNYAIWSVGHTVSPGANIKLELKLKSH